MNATRFDSQNVNPDGLAVIDKLKQHGETLARALDRSVISSRETSLAQTHLQIAIMFATRAVALQYKG